MEERRANARVPVELQVAYRNLNGFFADYTKNISRGGTFIPTSKQVELGTVFRFRLVVPGRAEPFEIEGVVVHNGTAGGEAGVGIRFQWDDDEARRSFEDVVERMLASSFGEDVARKLLARGDDGGH